MKLCFGVRMRACAPCSELVRRMGRGFPSCSHTSWSFPCTAATSELQWEKENSLKSSENLRFLPPQSANYVVYKHGGSQKGLVGSSGQQRGSRVWNVRKEQQEGVKRWGVVSNTQSCSVVRQEAYLPVVPWGGLQHQELQMDRSGCPGCVRRVPGGSQQWRERSWWWLEGALVREERLGKVPGAGRSSGTQRAPAFWPWLFRYSSGNRSLWGEGGKGEWQGMSFLCDDNTRSGLPWPSWGFLAVWLSIWWKWWACSSSAVTVLEPDSLGAYAHWDLQVTEFGP